MEFLVNIQSKQKSTFTLQQKRKKLHQIFKYKQGTNKHTHISTQQQAYTKLLKLLPKNLKRVKIQNVKSEVVFFNKMRLG